MEKPSLPVSSDHFPPAAAWGIEHTLSVCSRCDAVFLVSQGSPGIGARICPACVQGELNSLPSDHPALREEYTPELAIPFSISEAGLSSALERFCRSAPYPPEDLSPAKLAGRMYRVFLPVWLVDFKTSAEWQVEAGFDYQVVSHQDQYTGSSWQSRRIAKDRVRWEPRIGRLNRSYTNIPGPAIDAQASLHAFIGTFDSIKAHPYSPDLIEFAWIRLPNRSRTDAWPEIAARAHDIAAEEVRLAARADHQRRFTWRPEFSGQAWTLLLQPLLSTYYTDDEGRRRPVWINGQTGRIGGEVRASMGRALRVSAAFLAAAVLLFAIGLILALAASLAPPLLAVAVIAWSAAVVCAFLTVIPAARTWIFNRSREKQAG